MDNLDKIVAIGSIIFIVMAILRFWAGFHNIDLSRNVIFLAEKEGFKIEKYYDSGMGGDMKIDEMYETGMIYIYSGFVCSIFISIFLIGYLILRNKADFVLKKWFG